MTHSIFREYDIRGIFEEELNEITVKKIGFFLGRQIVKSVEEACYVAVGYDARTHSPLLSQWLTSGLRAAGLEVLGMGLVATPVNYFANYTEFEGKPASASVMITGSHNPPEYNGFKITVDKAPFFGEQIYALGEEVLGSDIAIEDAAEIIEIDAKAQYIDYMIRNFSHLEKLERTFVFDCGNGAAGTVLGPILEGLGITHTILFETPDGTFPNHHPDPSEAKNLEALKQALATGNYALGFAYDGDADRVAVLSRKYNFKGDVLALFFSTFMEHPTVIGEVKCSQIMYDAINARGKAIMYKTGHSNLKVKIKQTGADLAAEVSGHLFFNDRYFGYDDAVYATLRVLELLQDGFDFDAEFEKLPKLYSTDEINIETTEARKFELIEALKAKLANPPADFPVIKAIITVDGVRVEFENGWGLIRASNTTPKLVTRFEAADRQTALMYQEKLLELLDL